jgi:(2Fe-2S) ferredoxin
MAMGKPLKHVFVCTQMRPPGHPRGSCSASSSAAVLAEFQGQFESRGIWGRFGLTATGCIGPCGNGPSVLVYPEGVMYGGVRVEDVGAIIDEHLIGDAPVARLQVPAEIWG